MHKGSPNSNLGALTVVPYVLFDKARGTPESRWVRLQGRILGRQPVKILPQLRRQNSVRHASDVKNTTR